MVRPPPAGRRRGLAQAELGRLLPPATHVDERLEVAVARRCRRRASAASLDLRSSSSGSRRRRSSAACASAARRPPPVRKSWHQPHAPLGPRPTPAPEGTRVMQANHLPVARSDTTALPSRRRSASASTSSRVRRRMWGSTSSTTWRRRPSTAEELARRANTSSSTVVRFAQALGFEGFPELQAAARDGTGAREVNGGGERHRRAIDQTEFEAALAADHANVEARRVDRDEVAAAAELISGAERIVLCGTDQMAFFASYLRHLLMLLDLRAEVVASPSQEVLARLGRVDERRCSWASPAGRRTRLWSVPSSWPATAARRRSRSPTRPSPRSPSWRTTSSTTRRTVRPTCARTRCWE